MVTRSKSSTKSSYSNTDSPRLVEFVENLISSVEWPIYTPSGHLRETFTSLHATSQRALLELSPDARNELLIGLCALYGYRVSSQRKFANWTCSVVSMGLPFDLIIYGALIDTQSFQSNEQGIEEAILSIADEAPFVLVLDCADELQRERLLQDIISLVSIGYLANLITGVLALHYWGRAHQEILQRDAVADQLKSFLGELGISLKTAQLTSRRLGIG